MKETIDIIKKVNNDPEAIRREFDALVKDFLARHPKTGLAFAILIEKDEDDTDISTKFEGWMNYHQLMHAVSTLAVHIAREGMKDDPQGIESFFEEVKLKRQMKEFLRTMMGEDEH